MAGVSSSRVRPTLGEIERQYIERVLAETKGDKNAAARILGVSVRTLQRMFRATGARSDRMARRRQDVVSTTT
jgi:DNA-binding NtrC family response regulator